MYNKKYVYILKFYKGWDFDLAFKELDKIRQFLVYGFDLKFYENKLNITEADREIIYNEDNITIEKIVLKE